MTYLYFEFKVKTLLFIKSIATEVFFLFGLWLWEALSCKGILCVLKEPGEPASSLRSAVHPL